MPLTISTTVPVTVRYLALVGGYNSTNGGGLYAAENSRVTLDSSYVAGNKTKVQGAGIYLAEGSVVTMSSKVISENEIFSRVNGTETTKTCGGGVYIDDGTFNTRFIGTDYTQIFDNATQIAGNQYKMTVYIKWDIKSAFVSIVPVSSLLLSSSEHSVLLPTRRSSKLSVMRSA